jgi:hypothetical protein
MKEFSMHRISKKLLISLIRAASFFHINIAINVLPLGDELFGFWVFVATGSAINLVLDRANKWQSRYSQMHKMRRGRRQSIFCEDRPFGFGRSPLSLFSIGLPEPYFDVSAGRVPTGHAVRDSC